MYVKIGTDLSAVITADVEAPDGAEGDAHRYQMYDVLARTMQSVMDDRTAHRAWKSEVVAGNRAAARNVVVTPETDSLRERIAQGQLKIAHGQLRKIDTLLSRVFDDYKPGEGNPVAALAVLVNDVERYRKADANTAGLYEQHARPTLVEVHELDHERIEYDRAMSSSGEQGDETALPRMTHRRMHEALGLGHDHPYPNPFEYPEDDGTPGKDAGGKPTGKPFAETGEQVVTRHPDGTETAIDIVEVSPELQAAADAAAARAESELRPADKPTGPLPIPMPGPADEPTQEFKASDTITDPMPPVQVPPVDMDRAQEAAQEADEKPETKPETKRRPRR